MASSSRPAQANHKRAQQQLTEDRRKARKGEAVAENGDTPIWKKMKSLISRSLKAKRKPDAAGAIDVFASASPVELRQAAAALVGSATVLTLCNSIDYRQRRGIAELATLMRQLANDLEASEAGAHIPDHIEFDFSGLPENVVSLIEVSDKIEEA